jgi:hypothetical protein
MAAEMCTGAPALVLVGDAPVSVSMLVVGLQATYSKKIVGPSVFTFEDVEGIREGVEKAAESDTPQLFLARAVGRDGRGRESAAFEITWSFKRRSAG